MKGFVRRDGVLIYLNIRFFALFVAVMAGVGLFSDGMAAFASLYSIVLTMSAVVSLFSHDEVNGWQAYAAAAPGGRRGMVDARYCIVALVCAAFTAVTLLLSLGRGIEAGFGTAALYGGVSLLYGALVLPVCYHFGGSKARGVLILIIVLLSALGGMGGAMAGLATGFGRFLPANTSAFLLLLGLLALLLSWWRSRRIVERKEF